MHPTILKIGSFQIHSYGLLLAVAFLVSIQFFVSRGRRRGLTEESLHSVALVLLILAIVGGRGLFVLTHWAEYARDPLAILRLWEGGLMLYGGYVLAIAGGIAYVRRAGLPLWKVADSAAPAMALGIGIGRIGCFLNGCCFGLPTHADWGVRFPAGSYSTFVFPGETLHPSQLYLAGSGVLLCLALVALDRKPHFDGWLFWVGVGGDAVLRFLVDFTRYYDATSFLGNVGNLSFNINQVLSAFLLATALVMLRVLQRRPADPAPAPTGASDPAAAGTTPGIENPSPEAAGPPSSL